MSDPTSPWKGAARLCGDVAPAQGEQVSGERAATNPAQMRVPLEVEVSEYFVGRGIAFPMRISASGGIALVSRDEEIAESMRLILGTSPGERPMRPEFGCPIHDHVFAPADATTTGLIAFEVRNALRPAGSRGSTCSTSS